MCVGQKKYVLVKIMCVLVKIMFVLVKILCVCWSRLYVCVGQNSRLVQAAAREKLTWR